jgi:ferredoxin
MSSYKLNGEIFTIEQGETLFDAMERNNNAPEVKCGGVGQCGECVVKIISGREALSKMTLKEEHLLGNVFYITKERLGCQMTVNGDIEIDLNT